MALRSGLGPVFAYEWLTRSRRWQAYALRGLFVAALLAGLGLVWQSTQASTYLTTRQQLVMAGQQFFFTLTLTQLSLVLLAAPAATAGAICLDKARGTLAHVMVTDLSDREVVLGKLAARLVPVLNLIACALPAAALGTLLGGIDPLALTASILIATGVAVLGCSLALALSVWMAKAHEVMIVVFAAWLVWLLALPSCQVATAPGFWAPDWLKLSNPFWLTLAPYIDPGKTSLLEPVGFLLATLALSGGLAMLSVAKLRPVYLRQANRVPKAVEDSRAAGWFRRQVRWWPGPSLDKNPVLWREWRRNRPSRMVRMVWALYVALASTFSLKVIWDRWGTTTAWNGILGSMCNGLQVLIGLLFLAASAGTVLSEERVRGSLDVLLATPLSTRSIVWGKWWGAFRRVPWLAFWPTLVAFAMLPPNPPNWMVGLVYMIPAIIILQGAALVGLGLALATWISRTGRAATWTISALIASVVGWPILAALIGGPNDVDQTAIAMGSPFYNTAMATVMLEQSLNRGGNRDMERGVCLGLGAFCVAYALLAMGLYLATLLTFERCLGRTPERASPPRPRPEPGRRVGQAAPPSKARVG